MRRQGRKRERYKSPFTRGAFSLKGIVRLIEEQGGYMGKTKCRPARRVVLTIELHTPATIAELKRKYGIGLLPRTFVQQIQANVMKKVPKA